MHTEPTVRCTTRPTSAPSQHNSPAPDRAHAGRPIDRTLLRPALAWLLALGLSAGAAGAGAVAGTRVLLLDNRMIDHVENIHLAVGSVEKHPANPLFREDKPWEMRFDNVYANVIFDEEEQIYKCWYSPFIVDYSALAMSVAERRKAGYYFPPKEREMAICYATSKDGIVWEKPELGLVEYKGSTANNILWRGTGPLVENEWFGPHGSGVFKDARETNPAKRYKALLKRDILSVAFSPDGIHWKDAINIPEADSAGDTHNNAIWAPTLGKYVGITRQWDDNENVRQVAVTYSDDFMTWTKSEVVLQGITSNHQVYAMPIFFHGGVYLGLAAIHDQTSDRVWTELTWSPDTRKWHRISPGTPFIGNDGREGDYDWGCVYSAATPIITEKEIRIYYGSSDGKHHGWRNGFFCLATLRPDGWAGLETRGADDPGYVVTRPVQLTTGNLRVTADITPGGHVTASWVDANGKIIGQAAPVTESGTDFLVKWPSTAPTGAHRLRFDLYQAKLYSFVVE